MLVLNKYGGVIMDMDMICMKPIDELVHRYSFFASAEPATYFFKIPLINVGLIGTSADN
jgi:mannosyltransferase OCH1-like enzyme